MADDPTGDTPEVGGPTDTLVLYTKKWYEDTAADVDGPWSATLYVVAELNGHRLPVVDAHVGMSNGFRTVTLSLHPASVQIVELDWQEWAELVGPIKVE